LETFIHSACNDTNIIAIVIVIIIVIIIINIIIKEVKIRLSSERTFINCYLNKQTNIPVKENFA